MLKKILLLILILAILYLCGAVSQGTFNTKLWDEDVKFLLLYFQAGGALFFIFTITIPETK